MLFHFVFIKDILRKQKGIIKIMIENNFDSYLTIYFLLILIANKLYIHKCYRILKVLNIHIQDVL